MATDSKRRWQAQVARLGLKGKLPMKLTQTVVDAACRKPLDERYALADGTVPGLMLEVGPTGAATFTLFYRTEKGRLGKRRRLTLGGAGALSLDAAHKLAHEELFKVGRGVDPGAERKAAAVAAVAAERNTVRAYIKDVYAPLVLAHQKGGGGLPDSEKPESKGSGNYARLFSSWGPLLDRPIAALTRQEIEKVLADRKAEGKEAGTLIRDWSSFRAMLADAVDRGAMPAVPFARRPEPIRKTKGTERVRWLGQFDTDEQLAKKKDERRRFNVALDAFPGAENCSGEFLRFACRLALATGMRRGEIVRLTKNMIDERACKITLPKEITKSDKLRFISLNAEALAALKGWPLRGTKGELCPPEEGQTAEQAAVMWRDRITQQGFPELCKKAKITDLHFHDLRHDFAVRLLRSGATLAQVRDALGHASITQTEKYAHLVPGDVHAAVLRLGAGS